MPSKGEIIFKNSPYSSGHHVSTFTQYELEAGLIYYRHDCTTDTDDDVFELKLADKQSPPNKSAKYNVMVTVHKVLDTPLQETRHTSHQAFAKETEILFFGNKHLSYEDVESGPDEIVYMISSQPFFLTTTITIDAGRIVRIAENASSQNYNKHSQLPAVHEFSQRDVDQGRIAYVPPYEDIGPIRRQARFIYSVSDRAGNHMLNQYMDITLLPVNNRIPHMIVNKVNVDEGGTAYVTTNEISAYDPDTDQSSLKFMIESLPDHGTLWKELEQLVIESEFLMTDILTPTIRYEHDGTEDTVDQFSLSITDGTNTATKIVPISVTLINDNAPAIGSGLNTQIDVAEGGEVAISGDNLSATDDDTDDLTLRFVIVRSPQYGSINVRNREATEFTQDQVQRNLVKYVHTSGEIGIDAVSDSVTFAVRDEDTETLNIRGPLLDLNITILPVDNTHPYIILGGPMFVDEGSRVVLTTDTLAAHDLDTPMDSLQFIITKPPEWGFLQSSRTEQRLDYFTLLDISDRIIFYIQANHSGIEPLSDSFEVYVTDGGRSSHPSVVQISIVPQNDEVPYLQAANITVTEGNKYIFKAADLHINDVDVPSESLQLTVLQLPAHGLLSVIHGPEASTGHEAALPTYIDRLHLGSDIHLVYTHDGSENFEDSFVLEITDGLRVNQERIFIDVTSNNDEIPTVITNSGVNVIFGSVSLISSVALYTEDTDTIADGLYYIILAIPEKGYLQLKQGNLPDINNYDLLDANWVNLSVRRNFTQRDIDTNRLRYVHTGNLHDETRDQFIFHVSDGRYHTPKHTFIINILNTKSEDITLINKVLSVKEGGHALINTDYLSATEGNTPPGQLRYVITGEPANGYLSLKGTNGHKISSFTQRDVMADKLIYTHTSANDINDVISPVADDRIYYTVVSSGLNVINRTKSGIFRIHIEPLDRQLPTLDTLMPLTVVQSYEELLSSANLHVSDPDTMTFNLSYIITDPPVHGTILNEGIPVSTFTQYDLDQEHISYRSNTSDDVGIDFFLFTVTDNSHVGYLINGTYHEAASFFSILIQPLSKETPRLRNNKSPPELQYFGKGKYGFTLSRENLWATQPLSDSSNIVYSLLLRPEHGILYNKITKRGIKKRFTQYDLDNTNLIYMLYDETRVYNDTFTFRIQDSYRNTLDNQRFQMSWSIIDLDQPTYVACEDAGNVNIIVRRRGRIDGIATIEIKAKGLTAKEGHDYIPNSKQLLQFNPGEQSITWSIQVLRDSIKERDEKLRITLKSPFNAIIGRNDKATINIINYNNGRCADYIGMISGADPQITDNDELHNAVIKKPIYGEVSLNTDVRYGYRPYRDEARSTSRYTSVQTTRIPSVKNQELPRTQQEWDELLYSTEDNGWSGPSDNIIDNQWDPPSTKRKHKKKSAKGKRSKNSQHKTDLQLNSLASEGVNDDVQEIAPKPCDLDTKGLLYYDLRSSVMYRCDGSTWQLWTQGRGRGQMYQTSPLDGVQNEGHDAVISAHPTLSSQGASQRDLLSLQRKDCSQGWSKFHDFCYKSIVSKETWDNAEQRCKQIYDGHLAHIESSRHLEWVWSLADNQPFWIGLNDRRSHHVWEYTADATARYYHWRKGFPTSQRTLGKNCVLVSKEKEWVNRPCNKNIARYVCMKAAKTYNQNKKRRRSNQW